MIARQNLSSANGASSHTVLQLPEASLLAAARSGSSHAFEALCETHRSRLLKATYNITRNHEDAEDAVQDSLMRAFVHINNFQGHSSFSTWLTRIAINSALMIRRQNRRTQQVSIDEPTNPNEGAVYLQIADHTPNPEQAYSDRERKRVLRTAVAKLRPRVRAVIELGQLHELSMKETAKVLDISVAAAKGRFFHGRAALRRSRALRALARTKNESAA
jgi:RNA polymerase sigma-70 factor, ECF subfamily